MNKFYTNVSRRGNDILCREYINGETVNTKIPFKPTLFIPTNKESDWKGFYGEVLAPVECASMSEAREFKKKYSGMPDFEIHGDIDPIVQFLSEEYKEEIDYSLDVIRVCNFDIENNKAPDGSFAKVDNPLGEITSITVYDNIDDKYYLFTTLDWQLKDTTLDFVTMESTEHYRCKDEKELLIRFISHVHKTGYHVFTGWNIEGYDIPYLVNRCYMVVGNTVTKKLSPWGIINRRNAKDDFGNDKEVFDILGIATLDYLTLYKKFTYQNQESYTLDHIGFVEVGEKKLDYSEVSSLHELAVTNPQKFCDYNIKDVDLVKRIDDKMGLINLIYTLAYYSKVNVNDILSPVRTWDAIIYNNLKEKKTAVPPIKSHTKTESYAGAYVKEPVPGFKRWVVAVDLASMYPKLIMQYNLGIDTILSQMVEEINIEVHNDKRFVDRRLVDGSLDLSGYDDIIAANGTMYRRDIRGILPKLMDEVYNKRKVYKKEMFKWKNKKEEGDTSIECINAISKYHNLQMACKILLNSAYGACGNKHFRYFDIAIAEAITLSGQLAIQWVSIKINEFLNDMLKTEDVDYVFYNDTDSGYIEFNELIHRTFPEETDKNKIVDALDKFCAKILEPKIHEFYNELAEYTNAYENSMIMEREVIADIGIWVSKKRYVLNVHDCEGVRYKTPDLKVMGLESKKSSYPQICRDKMNIIYEKTMKSDNSEVIDIIDSFRSDWSKLELGDISSPRGCNGVSKYHDPVTVFSKKCPPHVKGALYHNKMIKDLGLENDIETIKNGDKVKYLPLRLPNPARSPIISFKGQLPKQFGLDEYVDYDEQFEKTFLDPAKAVLDSVGWKAEEISTLEDLFG